MPNNNKEWEKKFNLKCFKGRLSEPKLGRYVNISVISDGLSACCKAKLHVETSSGGKCNIACRQCGHGLEKDGVIFRYSQLAKVVNEIRENDRKEVKDFLENTLHQTRTQTLQEAVGVVEGYKPDVSKNRYKVVDLMNVKSGIRTRLQALIEQGDE